MMVRQIAGRNNRIVGSIEATRTRDSSVTMRDITRYDRTVSVAEASNIGRLSLVRLRSRFDVVRSDMSDVRVSRWKLIDLPT
jgi:hypothetical protein